MNDTRMNGPEPEDMKEPSPDAGPSVREDAQPENKKKDTP
jgi:hypothetical protein